MQSKIAVLRFLTPFCVSRLIPRCSDARKKSAFMRTNFETQSYYCRNNTKSHLHSKNLYHFFPEDIFTWSVANNCRHF